MNMRNTIFAVLLILSSVVVANPFGKEIPDFGGVYQDRSGEFIASVLQSGESIRVIMTTTEKFGFAKEEDLGLTYQEAVWPVPAYWYVYTESIQGWGSGTLPMLVKVFDNDPNTMYVTVYYDDGEQHTFYCDKISW